MLLKHPNWRLHLSDLESGPRSRLGAVVRPVAGDEDRDVTYRHLLPRRRVQLLVALEVLHI